MLFMDTFYERIKRQPKSKRKEFNGSFGRALCRPLELLLCIGDITLTLAGYIVPIRIGTRSIFIKRCVLFTHLI